MPAWLVVEKGPRAEGGGRRWALPVALLLGASSCAKTVAPAESPAEQPPADERSLTPPAASGVEVRAPAPQTARRFEPLCSRSEPWCVELEKPSALQGEVQLPTDQAVLVDLLRARRMLESGPLAFGEGGDEARKALLVLEEAQGKAAPPSIVSRLELESARAHLALGRSDLALPSLVDLAARYDGEPEVWGALGVALLAEGKLVRSLEPLARAARLQPNEPERHLVLGTARFLSGDYAQAEGSFRRALSLDGDLARAHGDLGALLLVVGRLQEGRQHLQRASLLRPKKATYLSNLAYAELLLARPEKAIRLAERATQMEPDLASAWLNLGLAQVAEGKRGLARASFERAQSLDPTDPRPRNNLADLEELEAQPLPEQ